MKEVEKRLVAYTRRAISGMLKLISRPNRLWISTLLTYASLGPVSAASLEQADAHRIASTEAKASGQYAMHANWGALESQELSTNFTLALPDGKLLQLAHTRTDRALVPGVITWIGHDHDKGPLHSAILSFNADHTAAFGTIQANGTILRVSTDATGNVTITDEVKSGLHPVPFDDGAIAPSVLSRAGSQQDDTVSQARGVAREQPSHARAVQQPSTASAADPSRYIDVDFLYTPELAQQIGAANVPTRVASLVALANQALTNSQVALQYRVAGIHQVSYPAGVGISKVLSDLQNFQATFAPARQWRDQDGADLVTLLRPYSHTVDPSYCGLAIEGGDATSDQQDAVGLHSVVNLGVDGAYSCDDTALAHELGHNLGAQHDVAHAQGQGAYPFSYGYGGSNWGDIMSYIYPHLTIFSNPNISTCDGSACGTATADVARTLNLTAATVSTYRASVQGDPGFYNISGAVVDQYGQPYASPVNVASSDPAVICSVNVFDYPVYNRFNCSVPTGTVGSLTISDRYNPSLNSQVLSYSASQNTANTITFQNSGQPTVPISITLQEEDGTLIVSSGMYMSALASGINCYASLNGFNCVTPAGSTGFPQVNDSTTGNYWDTQDPAFRRITDPKTFVFTLHPNHATMFGAFGQIETTDGPAPFIAAATHITSSDAAAKCTDVTLDGKFACWLPAGSSGTLSIDDPLGRVFTPTQTAYSSVSQSFIGSWGPAFTTGPTQTMPMSEGLVQGPQTRRTISGIASAAKEDAGQLKKLYVAAAIPGSSTLFFLTENGWVPWIGGDLPSLLQTTQDSGITFPIVPSPLDLTAINGTTIYAGLATSDSDLLKSHKYTPIYIELR